MRLKFNLGFIFAETCWLNYLAESASINRDMNDIREKLFDDMDVANTCEEYNFFIDKSAENIGFKKL